MRILHVITRLILGGAQQNTVLSCAGQVQAGHEVTLAYGPIYGPEGSLLEDGRQSGATLVELPHMRRSILPQHDWLCYRSLRKLIRQTRPDVVHSHSSKAGILVRAAAWKERVPCVIHTVHGLPFHDHQPRWVHRLYVGLERWAAKRCHHLVAITPEMVDAFVERDICSRDRFTVVPSGIDVDAFQPAPDARSRVRARYGIAKDAPVVGIVARLDKLKGHDDLLAIFDGLSEHTAGLRMLFVGDGFDRERLKQHPRARDGSVVLTGLVPLNKIADHLAAMDVKVLSSYQEGQSRTLCEALVAGVPIVAYAVGGIPSVCVHERTGLLAPVADHAALQEAVLRILQDPELAARLVEQGRVHVREHFSAAAMVEQLQAVYDRVLPATHPEA